ncbi:hypothetical protein OH76DRAFT_1399399 [Lentinus brumalis]|uniref:Uncharacterized protein n=1 Tax=Lentinus brumalis TaxID=2498619 RepID=A0A371DLT0_9APHY|nr:hypothetical protein OH76DRAFT_1399399 [Polyporus brumalis]
MPPHPLLPVRSSAALALPCGGPLGPYLLGELACRSPFLQTCSLSTPASHRATTTSVSVRTPLLSISPPAPPRPISSLRNTRLISLPSPQRSARPTISHALPVPSRSPLPPRPP